MRDLVYFSNRYVFWYCGLYKQFVEYYANTLQNGDCRSEAIEAHPIIVDQPASYVNTEQKI